MAKEQKEYNQLLDDAVNNNQITKIALCYSDFVELLHQLSNGERSIDDCIDFQGDKGLMKLNPDQSFTFIYPTVKPELIEQSQPFLESLNG